ncbi:MAG: RNA-binding cell elongation regulator Jag/EloR [Bacillota bacterium]|uniref:RNA-binding protein KhpB n=3 Tax=Fictibacillus TaxID=1329200 RepID=A0A168WCX8_9BACL|nr:MULTISPECIES: RNA-binding cell elongation regulator Jag/EloR [Fictibacillus]MBH0162284.1 protein jag [Fictibacillus sp. 26RED30]MBH0168766.1 protein jag [Fictibacillus sp. 18YEL24]ANC79199.1 protein jag [Fictibacillus phosphorivorans]MBD7966355.1 protein jag [Fictibacillus norfolkensis]MQR94228.1 protein jag [Fictibacillus phosphorivorans]
MKKVQVTGKTVEEAVAAALEQLQTSKDQVEISVLEDSKKGFFGLGGKPAVVEVTVKADPVKSAIDYLEDVTSKMGVPVTITQRQENDHLVLDLSGDKIAILIGKRGQTLNALQLLTNMVANSDPASKHVKIVLDAENYRTRRQESLERLAEHSAQKVFFTKKSFAFEPMPANERKVIHLALKENRDVETTSEGVEPFRKVVIRPTSSSKR